MINYFGMRYIDARAFGNEIRRLRIYRNYVGEHLLERLECARLVVPRFRIRYPEAIARRWWHEAHPEFGRPLGRLEPDGPRYEAAVDLANALHRRQDQLAYGACPHPLDELNPRFAEFVERPVEHPFVPWSELRLDVGNETYPDLHDSTAVTTLYSSWQLLLAAEVADMGAHYLINLADSETCRRAHETTAAGERPPAQATSLYFKPVYAFRDFSLQEKALDALVWFTEETRWALLFITRHHSGRFWLNETEAGQYAAERAQAAEGAATRYGVDFEDLVVLIRFLSERWTEWDHDGRSLVADEYKRYLEKTVLMARILGNKTYHEMRDMVGSAGGYFGPILDKIFPDWGEVEKNRARRTLKAMIRNPAHLSLEVLGADVDAFVDFIDRQNLHSFFWRLRSFEDHALRGNEFTVPGMHSDVQGMAVVVEHIARALGGTKGQLYEIIKELWTDAAVVAVLKRNDAARLARQRIQADGWKAYLQRVETLRQGSAEERIAADLALTQCIRGAVHLELPENDPRLLQDLFMTLLRAALRTFAHTRVSIP
jgi:hypothetical protein